MHTSTMRLRRTLDETSLKTSFTSTSEKSYTRKWLHLSDKIKTGFKMTIMIKMILTERYRHYINKELFKGLDLYVNML